MKRPAHPVKGHLPAVAALVALFAASGGLAACGSDAPDDGPNAPPTDRDHVAAREREGHGDEASARGGQADHEDHEEGLVELTPEAAERITLRVAPVTRARVPFVLRTTARVAYDERRLAHVSPRISGRAVAVGVELGADVKAGDRLAALDSLQLGEAKAEYLTARAREGLARKTRKRAERLRKERIASEQAMMEARAAHEMALVSLRAARERLRLLGLSDDEIDAVRYGHIAASEFELRAPIDGRVVAKHLVVGELITPQDKVFTIADLSHLWIWIDVYEGDIARVHVDDTVEVITDAYPDTIFAGRVAYVRDEIDADTRTVQARIDLSNPEGRLKPGMFANVVLTDPHGDAVGGAIGGAANSAREAVAVPASAVQRDGAEYIAFVKQGPRRYARRVVRLGARTDSLVEITSGLAVGEQVVVDGVFLLKSEAAKDSMGGEDDH